MSDNFEENVKQIAELLSQNGVIDSLKEKLNKKDSNSSSENSLEKIKNQFIDKQNNSNINFIQNMARAVSQLKDSNDPGINLLSALSPFLNNKRQKTCTDCVKILKTAKLFEFMKNNGEDFNL
jgi:hypothetical protein